MNQGRPDQRYTRPQLCQFATQLENIPPEIVAMIRNRFGGDEDDLFYQGMLSGLASAWASLQSGYPHMIGAQVAFVADVLLRREAV